MNATHWRPDPDADYEAGAQRRIRAAQFTPDIEWGNVHMRPRQARRVNRFLLLMAVGALVAAGAMGTARADALSGARTGQQAPTFERCWVPWSTVGAMGGRIA